MIDEELLYELSPARTSVEPRPMPEIARRARQLRAGRRVRRAGYAVVAVGLLAAVAVPMTGLSPFRQHAVQLPAVGGKDCGVSEVDGELSRYPEVAYLPRAVVASGLAYAPNLTRSVPDCVMPPAVGNWFSMSGSTVTKRFTVTGPGYPAPGAELMAETDPATVDLDGRTGLLALKKTSDADGYALFVGWVWWTEPDGSAWRADTSGMSRAEMLTAVRSLDVNGGELDTGRLPEGLTDAVPTYDGPAQGPDDTGLPGDLSVEYRPAGYGYWRLTVAEKRDSSWQAPTGSSALTVRGARAWQTVSTLPAGSGDDGTGGTDTQVLLTWQLAPGITGTITCRCDPSEAEDLATKTRAFDPADLQTP